jgi:23S rRNA pseudouridine1911/1915/1917 synthase
VSEPLWVRVDGPGRVERILMRATGRGRDHVSKLLRQERVWLESGQPRPLRLGERLKGGEKLCVRPPADGERPPPQPNRRIRLRFLYQDEALLVVDKASGLVMHPGPGHGTDTLLNALVAHYPDLIDLGPKREYGLVHRLDRGTSGVLVVARTAASYEALVAAFAERRVTKRYRALVRGVPDPLEGVVDLQVNKKPAQTRYRVVETRGGVSQVELWPHTGRTHQVRIHLADLGCPVLGDETYGSGRDEITARLYLTRLALHAEELVVPQAEGEPRGWTSPWPAALRKAWRRTSSLE